MGFSLCQSFSLQFSFITNLTFTHHELFCKVVMFQFKTFRPVKFQDQHTPRHTIVTCVCIHICVFIQTHIFATKFLFPLSFFYFYGSIARKLKAKERYSGAHQPYFTKINNNLAVSIMVVTTFTASLSSTSLFPVLGILAFPWLMCLTSLLHASELLCKHFPSSASTFPSPTCLLLV